MNYIWWYLHIDVYNLYFNQNYLIIYDIKNHPCSLLRNHDIIINSDIYIIVIIENHNGFYNVWCECHCSIQIPNNCVNKHHNHVAASLSSLYNILNSWYLFCQTCSKFKILAIILMECYCLIRWSQNYDSKHQNRRFIFANRWHI